MLLIEDNFVISKIINTSLFSISLIPNNTLNLLYFSHISLLSYSLLLISLFTNSLLNQTYDVLLVKQEWKKGQHSLKKSSGEIDKCHKLNTFWVGRLVVFGLSLCSTTTCWFWFLNWKNGNLGVVVVWVSG
jgi:hypothetical protein